MKIIDVEQNSDEWKKIRCGRFTASGMDQIITPTGKQSGQTEKYVNQIIAEIITGEPANSFKGNSNTDRGHALEDEASDYYAMLTGTEPKKVGFCISDDGLLGCSPDRFIGDDEYLEIKTCLPHVMVEAYKKERKAPGFLEQDHRPQTQCGLYVTERKRAITMLYCPSMKPIIVHVPRNTSFTMDMIRYATEAHLMLKRELELLQKDGYYEGKENAA